MNKLKLKQLLEQFFIEDIGERDLSSSIFEHGHLGELTLIAKENGIFCGENMIQTGFPLLDEKIEVSMAVNDGDSLEKGQIIASVKGKVAYLLQGERVILNLIQRMSGIATKTREAVMTLNSDHTKICDTRKTTPGLRMLEKYAVRSGGGVNHRMGLYDAVMLKDNHIAFAGSITKAVELIRVNVGHMVKIEVETETVEQVKEALEAKVDVIMFDNRSPYEIKEWMTWMPEHVVTEASGGITMDMLPEYGSTGVDYISLGYLTHSVPSLDISAKVKI